MVFIDAADVRCIVCGALGSLGVPWVLQEGVLETYVGRLVPSFKSVV